VNFLIWIGLIATIVSAFVLWANARARREHAGFTRKDVEAALEEFVWPDSVYHDTWDLLLAWPIDDPYLESIRQRCRRVVEECPREKPTEDISQAGVERIRTMLAELRGRT
jgi:hypothetical protein